MASRKLTAKQVWAAIGVCVLAYNLTADEGAMLSQKVDEWLLTYPILTRAAVLTLAAHLINVIPPRYDPVHLGFNVIRKLK